MEETTLHRGAFGSLRSMLDVERWTLDVLFCCSRVVGPRQSRATINVSSTRNEIERALSSHYCEPQWLELSKIPRGMKSSLSFFSASGTLLFLALISYAPKDLPSWIPFSHISPPNRPAQNFIGPFGAIIAGFSYLMIGAASYLLAVVLLGFGGAKLFHSRLRVTPRLVWIVLFVVSGACLFQLQTQHLQGWRSAFNIQGPGGWVGYSLGKKLLQTWMGGVGSVILLTGVYVSSLILMTGLRPIHLVRQTVTGLRNGMTALREWELKRRLRKSDLKGQLEISQRELAKQQRVIEKQLKKKGAPVPEPTGRIHVHRKNWPTGRSRKWSIPPRCRTNRRAKSLPWRNSAARRRKRKALDRPDEPDVGC